jgi:histidyl-tRNA synthetase
MELSRVKGTRDFLPEDKIIRNKIMEILRNVFEKYGFNPLETPVLERRDVLSSKYAGGAEILKEIYQLKDQGKRELGLRYDLTVPFSRVIAMNKGLRMPFKRYAMGRVFRDGPLKPGRYREFWQCDVDVVGCPNYVAEVELMRMVKGVFKEIGIDIVGKINDRRVLNAIVEKCGVANDKINRVILVLDKIEKIGASAVKKELNDEVGIDEETSELLLEKVGCKGSNEDKLQFVEEFIGENEGLKNLKDIFSEIEDFEFSPMLARGLAYYTGTVFEIFLREPSQFDGIKSSVCAGGRFDDMVGNFIGDGKKYPAVGISFGLDILSDILRVQSEKEGLNKRKSIVDIYVISIGCFDEARRIVEQFREGGLKADLDLLDRGIGKNMNYASKAGIPYVIFVGKEELAAKKVKLKDMSNGEERLLGVNECFKILNEKLNL